MPLRNYWCAPTIKQFSLLPFYFLRNTIYPQNFLIPQIPVQTMEVHRVFLHGVKEFIVFIFIYHLHSNYS